MPQQPSNDGWETINPPQDSGGWETINPPQAMPMEVPDAPSMLEDWNNLWMNQPLSHKLTGGSLAPAAAEFIDSVNTRSEDQWKIPSWMGAPFRAIGLDALDPSGGTFRSLFGGMAEGATNVAEGFTSPLNLATMGAAKGATSLASSSQALNAAGKAAEAARRANQARQATIAARTLSAPVMGTGAARIGEGLGEGDWQNVFQGVTELAGGAAGVKMPVPKGRMPTPAISDTAPPMMELPLNRPAPIEPVVDPNFAGGMGNPEMAGSTPYPAATSNAGTPSPTLPRDLAGAKPRFNIGADSYFPKFADDLDKAFYIIAQVTKSKRDGDYLNFVMQNTGLDEASARAIGAEVRQAVKQAAVESTDTGAIDIPSIFGARQSRVGELDAQIAQTERPPVLDLPTESVLDQPQGFDPNSLQGLQRAEPQFVNPETGEVRPASQAQPGDVPITGQQNRGTGWRPNLGPSNRQMFELSNQVGRENQPVATSPDQVLPHEFAPDTQLINEPTVAGGTSPQVVRPPVLGLPEQSVLPPEQPKTLMDWLNNLAKSESGEFDMDALSRFIRGVDEPVKAAADDVPSELPLPTRATESPVPLWNRQEMDRMTSYDDLLRYVQNYAERNSPEARAIVEYGQNRLGELNAVGRYDPVGGVEQLHDWQTPELQSWVERNAGSADRNIQRAADYGSGILSERVNRVRAQRLDEAYQAQQEPLARNNERYWWNENPPEPPSASKAKSLDEVEAGKKAPALQRLGKLIGEDRAQQLATGERQLEFSEKPSRVRGKRLDRNTVRTWGEWGDAQIKDIYPDSTKPGIDVQPHGLSNMFPNSFEVVFRDPQGNPLGMLRTNLDGTGISDLAVSSKIGLRRGKVAFALLKEAFDRGISEPAGATSDFTKNLIDRVKRLAKSESGEFDADVVIDTINKFIDTIANSKVGKAVSRFVKGESGEVDMDRLAALFKKQQDGSITPQELAEAKAMAQEYQATQQAAPAAQVTGALNQRLQSQTQPPAQTPPTQAGSGGGRRQPPALVNKDNLQPNVPIQKRKAEPGFEQSMPSQIWNASRSLQSIDLPGMTSAALRQSRPLAFTSDWFKAWNTALKSFGSKEALDAVNAKISNSKYFKPRYQPVMDRQGNVVKYIEKPSIAEELGVKMTDVIHHREEAIVSSLAEKIPGYGRYVKASNRAYTGFLNDLRAAKFEQLMEGAKALGRDPEVDVVLGKKLADFVNNATGRGSLKFLGGKINLEPAPVAEILGHSLYSPRALAARLSFMNPANYTTVDPLVRKEYWKSLARIGVSWGAASGLASLMPGVTVSTDPNSADFGKIRVGNTRYDPGAGFQQLLVLSHRMLPKVLGGGGTSSSSTAPGQQGKFTSFGSTPLAPTRLSLMGRYIYNQMHPSLRFVFDMLSATSKQPFDLTDRSLQMVLPMYASDIAEAAKGDASVADFFAPLLSSMGTGVQSYEKGSFGKPQITPFIKQVMGVDLPTTKIGQ